MKHLTAHDRRERILIEVREERLRQITEYDDSGMLPESWIARIAKHLGRAVTTEPETFRRSLVVIAALAVAAIEWLDGREGR